MTARIESSRCWEVSRVDLGGLWTRQPNGGPQDRGKVRGGTVGKPSSARPVTGFHWPTVDSTISANCLSQVADLRRSPRPGRRPSVRRAWHRPGSGGCFADSAAGRALFCLDCLHSARRGTRRGHRRAFGGIMRIVKAQLHLRHVRFVGPTGVGKSTAVRSVSPVVTHLPAPITVLGSPPRPSTDLTLSLIHI